MEPVSLIDLAASQARWLAARQAAVASNVANANTPGYQGMDVEPFAKVLDKSGVTLAATQAGHLSGRATDAGFALKTDDAPALLASGNNVTLENELMKAGEIRREFELNTAVVKAFHRMLMLSAKS